jgi:outer membrane receptor protein involved in Fe transport
MRFTTFLLFALFSFFTINAQTGKLTGKVTNNKNEAISGATIEVTEAIRSTITDVDGRFVFTLSPGKYSVVISYVGYTKKSVSEVVVSAGKETSLDLLLEESDKNQLNEVVIKATPSKRETQSAMIAYQRNTAVVAQVISAEAIRRSPDKNTGEVLKRVPGTSVQEGKYLVVRGLSDRYNQAMLNGVMLSSTEPDRKTFSYDLFPAPMVDNIVMNKTFTPELPGEWAGGLVQVQTKEIPTSDFLQIQVGTGFNSATIGKDFYKYKGGNLDWLGVEDGTRKLADNFPTKSAFNVLSQAEENEYAKSFRNVWSGTPQTAPLNKQFQLSSGFTGKLFGKKAGGIIALTYNQTNRRLNFDNAIIANDEGTQDLYYKNNKYSQDVLAGALANFSIQFDNNNRISFKNILNVNSTDYVIDRYDGRDYILGPGSGDKVKAQELGFRQNTFFNTQILGEHNFPKQAVRVKWYGSFNILDQYIPEQHRLFYTQNEDDPSGPYIALLGAGASQKSGSLYYSWLNDNIYNAGTDISKSFNWLNGKQAIKAGYLFQVKDRLFDSRPFFYNTFSNEKRLLPPDQIFAPENLGVTNNDVQVGELTGLPFRYMANTILNAGYLQFDNEFGKYVRVVWGARVEDFDQLIGSPKQSDPRHVHSRVTDVLPGVNLTIKASQKTNIRLSGSQTVVRPEFRELSPFAFYDFELNAQVQGNQNARRTKVTNADIRYEYYPAAGELFTIGGFYKHFNDPIEYYFNRTGPATTTFNIQNSDEAEAYGAELEFRKKLDFIGMKNFIFSGNLSYIYSKVKDTISLSRPLQGQSPYLINFGLQYDHLESGWAATLLFNQIGKRILFVGNVDIPEIWENPRPLLDFQIAKKLMKDKAEIRLNISDILNRPAYFYHDLNGDDKYSTDTPGKTNDALAISRNYGTNVNIIFAYTFK